MKGGENALSWAPKEIMNMAGKKEVKVKTTRPQMVAYIVHKGQYSQLGEVFKKGIAWANENGYEVDGSPRTIYYSEAGSVPDDELITEVQIPIKTKSLAKRLSSNEKPS